MDGSGCAGGDTDRHRVSGGDMDREELMWAAILFASRAISRICPVGLIQ